MRGNMLSRYKIFLLPILSGLIFSHGISESDKTEIIQGSLIDYLYLGAKHMITGYDHILFLIGVIFFLTRYRDIVKFVTAFTIGHSITLIFATLFKISANYYLIDAVIAFSVIYKGFENLDGFKKWLHKNPPNLVLMVFIFGLIHGFGLSTRLQQLNLMEHDLIYSILSFNVGVELGQIGALLIVFPFILMIRKESFKRISILLNWGLIILGMLLLIYQLNGYFRFEGHHHNEIHEEEIELGEHNHDTKETPPSHDHNDKNHSHDEHSHSHD
tara:strand:+ start:277 stop:1092 length:816 start_codon:yes stop_codon:yes gene_type:complete